MKKLGLIGGTGPESTLIYYREINRRIHEETKGERFPEISIESVNLHRALGYVEQEKYEELSQYLSAALHNLAAGGAEILALTAGTMHVVYDDLKEKASVPLISIPESVCEAAAGRHYKRVGLLGTIFTMEKHFFKKVFMEKGVDVIVPSEEDRNLVDLRISTELEYGIVKDSTREELIRIIAKMKEQNGIEAVILGCTELPLALNPENCPVGCLDIMEIHIQTLVGRMMD